MNDVGEGSARLINLLSEGYLDTYNTSTFQQSETFNRAEYILTASGNKVSRNSILCGMKNIHMLGKSIIKSGAMLRGDLSSLYFGKYVIVGSKTLICPCFLQGRDPQKQQSDQPSQHAKDAPTNPSDDPTSTSYVTLTIGDNVYIGNECIIKAALIGSNVIIGNNCVVGERVVIKDNVIIKDNTYIPNDTIIASFAKYAGCPATYVKELPESAPIYLKGISYQHYKKFIPES
ncbi:dynactin subunit 5, putative [Plasmodium knowlesi strain H]|uniref:Dynactin subunit 5 n=3 Tax=Plasmodium knowlesi TaxID=5850 RepID=A0A5K1VJM3_PLAKH|nr:dynactin subunit 5, putative [Plasmodium knowlesi strain H]OTN68442.1 putative Dynactin 4 [Plasmodium knowlesi]CAA9986614.1 dynactin subunit 5, putative [Plasmodium knowlesi strain H]SBO24109.1 dynactin subunit 5, putative [Plasmodium knowlesi strain H]SBO29325.1 dynactin subunit 5, putative [Plasmodium knowlesi strain H]VVS76088.1 dynactin subunit 5, putative [Plasmodium knowlesi strain H]|eukprot:XP_002261154.1 dynactin 4, putative [Plasmodium knowlesi strain H]